ncbi:MAG: cytochrome C [Nitrospirae bacterium]|nr:cytochrome C [Nitrospirota bacterium]
MVTIRSLIGGTAFLLVVGSLASAIAAGEAALAPIQATSSAAECDERGRYLVKIAGCNDCHTAGYAEAAGKIPEKDWLTGDRIGWRGPWGTTYPGNLRLYMQHLSEEQWVLTARTTRFRPPMPWFVFRDMTEQDLRAIYRFIRGLGPAGEEAPDYLPPDQKPPEPYISFPQTPKQP